VHFLQIKLPACRNVDISKKDKKFSRFGHLQRDIFTRSQLKTSKKPRGYRIFLKICFCPTSAMDSQEILNILCAFASSQKIIKNKFGYLSNFLKIFEKNGKTRRLLNEMNS
jgi:hypothetical protein